MSSPGPAPVLLDTHYWVWMQLGEATHFTARMLGAIRQAAASGSLLVSAISVWELGMLEAKGRIRLKPSCEEWVREALATPGLLLAPLTPEIALDSSRLPEPFHGDPADRIIVATARRMGAQLMTRDRRLIQYGRRGHVAIL
ncbi:MAG: type II toxin-antitoxin system VapC family toxin [Bryobacteraceae bacterium]